jgi:competence protein ComEC
MLSAGSGLEHALDRAASAVSSAAQRMAPGDRGALLAGLVTGDDAALSSERRQDFYLTGTSHITAVSGGNLAILVGAVGLLAGRGRHRRSWRRAVAILAVVWLYALLVGAGPPIVRAAAVASTAAFAPPLGRRADLVTLAAIVAAGEALATPAVIHSLSYQLSTAAAVALALALGNRRPESWTAAARMLLVGSVAAQLATLPVLAATVGMPSPWALPANVVVVPLVAAAYPMALVGSAVGLVSTTAADVVGVIPAALAGLILRVVERFGELPGATQTSLAGETVAIALVGLIATLALGWLSPEIRGGARRMVRDATVARGEAGWLVLGLTAGIAAGAVALAAAR